MTARKPSKTDPQLLEMPAQKMAVVSGKGAPDKVFSELMPALYGSVYTLKFDLKKRGLPTFKVTGLRARYPDAHLVPKDEWTHIIGLPIPEDTASLTQKAAGIEVKIETWGYGTVAQILHLGAYDQETATIERLTVSLGTLATRLLACMKRNTSLALMLKSSRLSLDTR